MKKNQVQYEFLPLFRWAENDYKVLNDYMHMYTKENRYYYKHVVTVDLK